MIRPKLTTQQLTRLRETLALRPVPHVPRGLCVDCDATVVLMQDGSCPCGSRSVMVRRAA